MTKREKIKERIELDYRRDIWERRGRLTPTEVECILEMAGPPQTQVRCILMRRIALEVPGDAYRDKLQHIVDALDYAFQGEQIGGSID